MTMFDPRDDHDYSKDYTPEATYTVTIPNARIDMSMARTNRRVQPIITRTN